jgi:hypothetical protein
VAIWSSALIITIILGILLVTQVVGTWVILIQIGLAMGVSLLHFRVEIEQKKREADDHDE